MKPSLPDELRYWRPGPRVRPFHYRWLLPAVCGQKLQRWKSVQIVSLGALGGLLWVYTGKWWACLLILGCSGVLFNLKWPVLVDLPAMALALGAAVAWRSGLWWLAIILALIVGAVKETSPVFAAVWAWNPVLLVGLVSPFVRHFRRSGTDTVPVGTPAALAISEPFSQSWQHHKDLAVWTWVLPWGVLLAALANPSPQLGVCLALAYAQCIVATDTVRLYQWALPVVALCAVPMLAGPWLAVALVLHIVSPFRTEGL